MVIILTAFEIYEIFYFKWYINLLLGHSIVAYTFLELHVIENEMRRGSELSSILIYVSLNIKKNCVMLGNIYIF